MIAKWNCPTGSMRGIFVFVLFSQPLYEPTTLPATGSILTIDDGVELIAIRLPPMDNIEHSLCCGAQSTITGGTLASSGEIVHFLSTFSSTVANTVGNPFSSGPGARDRGIEVLGFCNGPKSLPLSPAKTEIVLSSAATRKIPFLCRFQRQVDSDGLDGHWQTDRTDSRGRGRRG